MRLINTVPSVFLTDGAYKHTLSAVRSLGRKNIAVAVGSHEKISQCFYSKYCKIPILYPPPSDEGNFVKTILKLLKNMRFNVLLPIGYQTSSLISRYKDKIVESVKTPIADYDVFNIAADKLRTIQLAERMNIKVPKTVYIENVETLRPEKLELELPMVVKGRRESVGVFYIKDKRDFEYLKKRRFKEVLVQEYVIGDGYGFFGLFNQGKIRASFMHKRIREYPATGGPSTLAESIYDIKLKNIGKRLLERLKWHGVAMVEFKRDVRTGEFILMEINPKFWGSLDLSIRAGVDFPFLAYKLALDGEVEKVCKYKTGIVFKWPFPDDTMHLLSNLRILPSYISDFLKRNTYTNIDLYDLKPTAIQITQTFTKIYDKMRS